MLIAEPLKAREIDLFPKTLQQEVMQNVRIIISSPKFSVPLDRGFGTSHTQIDTPTNIAQPKLIMEIIDEVEKYEPRAEIIGVEVITDEAYQGRIFPRVEMVVKDEWE